MNLTGAPAPGTEGLAGSVAQGLTPGSPPGDPGPAVFPEDVELLGPHTMTGSSGEIAGVGPLVGPVVVGPVVVGPLLVEPLLVEPLLVEPLLVEPLPVEPLPVGPALVGLLLVDPPVVGSLLVGPLLVDPPLVEPLPVGPALVGPLLVDPPVVGSLLVGPLLVGSLLVGPLLVSGVEVAGDPLGVAGSAAAIEEPASRKSTTANARVVIRPVAIPHMAASSDGHSLGRSYTRVRRRGTDTPPGGHHSRPGSSGDEQPCGRPAAASENSPPARQLSVPLLVGPGGALPPVLAL